VKRSGYHAWIKAEASERERTDARLRGKIRAVHLAVAGIEPSISRAGNPYDNARMESFNPTYKRECVGLAEEGGGYATRAEATYDFFDYVGKYYNRTRRHSALGYQTPVDFENQLN